MDGLVERSAVTGGDAPPPASARRPRIVIIGAGFGGLSAAQRLARVAADVTVIDRRNHHVFQPLLYQVATAGLDAETIAAPIRAQFTRARNVEVHLGDVDHIDLDRGFVQAGSRRLAFEYLIVAPGSSHSYGSHPEWEAVAPGLKTLEQAVEIRRRILGAFERAENEPDEARRQALIDGRRHAD